MDTDEAGNAHVAMLASDAMRKLMPNHLVPDGHCTRLLVYVAGTKKAVVERDTDLLTPDDF
eukprot:605288-Pyramimonas_sp.AAC.1